MFHFLGMVACCPNNGERRPITPKIGHLWAWSGGTSFETDFGLFGITKRWIQEETSQKVTDFPVSKETDFLNSTVTDFYTTAFQR